MLYLKILETHIDIAIYIQLSWGLKLFDIRINLQMRLYINSEKRKLNIIILM
jgi:hypothetical protein